MWDVTVKCAASSSLYCSVCIVCSLVMFVVDAIAVYIVAVYSSIGLFTALYVKNNIFLCLPHLITLGKVLVCRIRSEVYKSFCLRCIIC